MKFNIFATCFLLMVATTQFLVAAERVRVETVDGVPQIRVDGESVRARMFFGNPGVKEIEIDAEPRRISFDFTALESAPESGTLHFRFSPHAATVFLDDISVEELDAEGKAGRTVCGPYRFENGMDDFNANWLYWPTGEANTTGDVSVQTGSGDADSAALRIRLTEPGSWFWPDFHLHHKANLTIEKSKNYRVSFWVKSDVPTAIRTGFYRPGSPFVFLGGGGEGFFARQIQMSVASGARFVSYGVPLPWPEAGKEVDWTEVDDACRRVLDADPEALLIPRIPMDPPAWWVDAFSDDIIRWEGTPHEARKVAAVSSVRYRKDAAERLDAFVRHVEEKFGPHVAGYHPSGQNTGEWFYQDSWGPALNGYAKADEIAWRSWLTKRYGNDAAIQKAWGDDSIRLADVEVPSPERRQSQSGGAFLDVHAEKILQSVLDFNDFQQEMMSETVLTFAKCVRQASKGKRLVVMFYGYTFEFGNLPSSPATSGHYALRRVLESPDIDILCSPISYIDRQSGGSGAAMSAAESVASAGKLWLYEDDTKTHKTPRSQTTFPGAHEGGETLDETRNLLLRNTAQCSVRNFGTWWMDLGAAGWFDDPALWEEMKKLEKLDRYFLEHPTPFRPEVAAFMDEPGALSVAFGARPTTRPAFYEIRVPLARMGTPFGQYLLDDFIAGKVDAKLNVFVNAWRLSKEQRRALKNRAAKPGTVDIWCYAPGFLDTETGGSVKTIKELTGFDVEPIAPVDPPVNGWGEPTTEGRRLGLETGVGVHYPVRPLFTVKDAKPGETLAVYHGGAPAIVMRQSESGAISIFVGPPGLNSELLRIAARKAGVHLFTQQDCNVYANGPAVVLHGATEGSVEVDFGKACDIKDLMDGSVLGKGPKIEIPLQRGETRVLSGDAVPGSL